MTSGSPKFHAGIFAFPRRVPSILTSVAVLAVFLVVASRLLVSYPVNPTIYGRVFGSGNQVEPSVIQFRPNITVSAPEDAGVSTGRRDEPNATNAQPVLPGGSSASQEEDAAVDASLYVSDASGGEAAGTPAASGAFGETAQVLPSVNSSTIDVPTVSSSPVPTSDGGDSPGSCDLYKGKWVYDSAGPLYTNNSCPVITQMQNCQGNGRPDKEYESWRWKPDQCNLPRFDARKFLELMRGKTLAFVGDSVARNQMESLLCILWQVEAPKNRGNRRMQRWQFKSTSTMIVRIWSSWLVHQTPESIEYAPEGVTKVHLDVPDETFMDFLPNFDVVVLSSGHWFAKQSVYVLDNKIVGGQLWWPDKSRKMEINNINAFGVSVETSLSAIATNPNFTGLAVVRSFSPDHYEGGEWNTGGSCTGKTSPASELVRNGFTDAMHGQQVTGFNKAVRKAGENGARLKLMDITEVFSYRHDGHPGPYRSPDPNKVTKRGPNGQPPPQDCLHWCMPGPVDTWNEILMEVIRREFERA